MSKGIMYPKPTPSDRVSELAPELLELILSYLNPRDLTSFGRTCQRAQAFVQPGNKILWRYAFLQVFDDPKASWAGLLPTTKASNSPRELSWDWYHEVHRRYTALNTICDSGNETFVETTEYIVKALLDVFDTASYAKSAGTETRVSLNLDFLDHLFRISSTAEKIVHDYHRDIDCVFLPQELMIDDRPITRSMVARRAIIPEWASRFHILFGPTRREGDSLRAKSSARGIVYDWRVTGPLAEYGPLVQDGSGTVNWQTLEAISSLMHRTFNKTRGSKFVSPTGFKNNIPFALSTDPLYPDDWAGVTRMWVGTYAFLDYRALVHYNFANHLAHPMDLGEMEEACGDLMRLNLQISQDEDLKSDPRLISDLPYCKDLPKLYFEGQSGGVPTGRPPILVRGSACLNPGARQVRWRFIISYANADQWQLEGVQPGGIRSGGIYGLWSHVDHDEHGPMGPFFYAPYENCRPPHARS